MPTPPLSDEVLANTIRRVEDCLKEGFGPPWLGGGGGAIQEACRRAIADGVVRTRSSWESRYAASKMRLRREPDWSLYRAPVYQSPTQPEHFVPIIVSEALKPSGKRVKVAAIGDCHNDPRLPDKSRFKWMGRWANDIAADYVVQIGDWETLDSVSGHAAPGTLDAMENPSFRRDLDSCYESHKAFKEGLAGGSSTLVFTEGNHEIRAARFENKNPNMRGLVVPQLRSIFTEHGWRIHEFGEYAFIEGVGFIHHPINGAGKAYGGKTGNHRAANEAMFSIVHGHDHRRDLSSSPKIGPSRPIDVVSIGCSLPWGHVEHYAKHGPAGWWWGVTELTIQDGVIVAANFIDMLELEARYGK